MIIMKGIGDIVIQSSGAIYAENILQYGIDALFICRRTKLDYTIEPCAPSQYWGDSGLVTPKDLVSVAIFSKYAFKYPRVSMAFELPNYSFADGEYEKTLYFGLGNGTGADIISFYLDVLPGEAPTLNTQVSTGSIGFKGDTDVSRLGPLDFTSGFLYFDIVVLKNLILFFINNWLVHVVVTHLSGLPTTPRVIREDPNSYRVTTAQVVGSRVSFYLEQYVDKESITQDTIAPITPTSIVVREGYETQQVSMALLRDNTPEKLAGYVMPVQSVASQPFPVYGYSNKTIYFMADTPGTLDIEVLELNSGNWVKYDSISVTANKLHVYRIQDEALLARIVFTSQTYPANILAAEVHLS